MKKITLFFMTVLLFSSFMYAQDERGKKFIKYDNSKQHQLQNAKDLIRQELKLSSDDDLIKIQTNYDNLGFVHEAYQQYFKGVKVEFGTFKVHAKNGRIQTMNGELFPVGKVNVAPTLSSQAAFQKALNYVGAEEYLWENPEQARIMGDYQRPAGELMILPAKIFKGQAAKLVYKFDVYATKPISRANVYVDAHSGRVVFEDKIIKHVGEANHFAKYKRTANTNTASTPLATGNAQTRYSGTRAIETTLSGGNYILRETTRGNGIETYDMNLGTNYNSAVDFTDNDNNWTTAEHSANFDDAALDAHWGAEMTYDYFQQTFNRNSYDDNGAKIKSYVHFNLVQYGYPDNDNAFWNGSVMTYGDGTSFDPLTSLDIAAHEIGHAVCENTANLVYSYESGAMNEAFSDIWAASVEYFADPSKQTWLLAEEIGGPIRSLSNPNDYGQPDTYQGTNWYTGTADNGGVHYNSGVLNHWFYILTVGKSGTNDNGDSFNVTGIGIDKSAAIAYRMESVYMTSNAQYADARSAGISAAEDLYGTGSAEVIATTNAFYAVGVGAEYVQTCSLPAPGNLASTNINDNGFSLSWNSVSGAASYTVTIGGTPTTVSGTSYTATGLTSGTSYTCSVAPNCSVGGTGTVSTINVTTTGTAPLVYCSSNGNSVADEYIGRVQIGTIDNASNGSSGGYADYTSISTDLSKGSSVTITITPTWTGTLYNEGYSVWIDYNKDGDFADSGEQVWTAAASQNTPVSGTFTVPTSAVTDATRMRVSMKYNGIPTACEAFSYGEVEDYTVNLVTGTADTTPPVITLNGASTIDLQVGDTYTELGATATDNVDGDISGNIVITGTVDTNTAGTYSKFYNVSDAAGNAATQVTRTINVTQPTGGTCSTTVSSFPYSEGFETSFGAWSQSTDDDMDWTRDSNGTPSSSTGPSSAAEGTFYIYTEASSPNYPSKVAILDGPCFDLSGVSNPTITFQYHMYGATMGTLSLQARPDGSTTWTTIWSLSGNQGNAWQQAEVSLSSYSTVQLRFNNSTGSSYTGDATIDNIVVGAGAVADTQAPTAPSNLTASNTTETSTDLSWNASTDNVGVTGYDVYQDGSVIATVTGTSYQVTGLSASTAYAFYVNAKDAAGNVSGNSNTVNVTTATPADTTAPVITLNGSSTINLQVGDTYTELGATATDNVDGDISANIVITGTVDTNTAGTYSRFYNVSDAAGNAATQVTRTIIVTQPSTGGCSGGITSFPYSESFENTLGAWVQSSADDFNWTVDANGTPSSSTGPSSASAGTYYVYMESSSPNYSNKRAILNSPCFDLGGESQASFTFDYHMYGASTMGSLALEVSDDNGMTWTSVWSKSGNQGNAWQSASVNLDAYVGGSIQLRFNGITGTTWQGDMAVDNVGFSTSGGGGGTACSNVTLSITFDNYPEETAWSITNASGQTVASGGTYGSQADGSTLNINVGCLDDGCYDFTITDTYGDGICCTYGNGSYTLTNNDTGATLASGGSFASSETTNFCLSAAAVNYGFTSTNPSGTDDLDKQFVMHPNPVDNMLNVDLIGFEAQTFVVKNMLGQVVLKGRYTSSIDVSDLQSGVYVLQLNIGEKTKVKRFVKK